MYQTTYFASLNPDPLRLVMDVTGYSEGWATYVELLSYHLSGLDENLASAMEANLSYTLGLYCLIDIGIHYEGWSREDTADFLSDYGITSSSDQDMIFEIIVSSPGNYLNYYVGYLNFLNYGKQQKMNRDSSSLKRFSLLFIRNRSCSF